MLLNTLRSASGNDLLRLAGGSAIFFFARVAGAGAAYVTQVLLARWLGGEEFGSYVRANSWGIVLANLAVFGMGTSAVRFIGTAVASNDGGRIRGFVRASRLTVLVLGTVVAAMGAVVVLLIGDALSDMDRRALLFILLCIPAFAFMQLDIKIAQSLSLYVLAALPNNTIRPMMLLGAVIVASTVGLAGTAANVVLIHLGIVVVCVLALNRLLSLKLNQVIDGCPARYEWTTWLTTAWPLMLTVMFTRFFAELNLIVLSLILPNQQIAVFNSAFRTALLINFGLVAVDSVIMPQVSKLYAKGDLVALQRVVTRATRLKFWCSIVGLIVLALVGKSILRLFGEDFVDGYEVLLILATTQVLQAALGPAADLLSLTGHQYLCLKVFACILVVVTALHFFLDPIYGIKGAAIAVISATVIAGLWLRWLSIRHIGIQPSIFG